MLVVTGSLECFIIVFPGIVDIITENFLSLIDRYK